LSAGGYHLGGGFRVVYRKGESGND
jgi:hypothetical protein